MIIHKRLSTQNESEQAGKLLLLANKDKTGLFTPSNQSTCIPVLVYKTGEVIACGPQKEEYLFSSVSELVSNFLGLRELHANSHGYLVTPEMEVERIFNSLRYKYLLAVHLSKAPIPKKFLHSSYNKAFQALAGLQVYQGNPPKRKTNDDFWQEAGFTSDAKNLDWQKEQEELKRILTILKIISPKELSRAYSELIAIKPGFHELYLHDDYFNAATIPAGTSPRDQVFRMLRKKELASSLTLDKFPQDINKRNYFGYAPCNVTEGPFVFRKNQDVSYFDEIRRIQTKPQIRLLDDKFHILDYRRHDLSTQDKLERFLELAEPFCRYPALTR